MADAQTALFSDEDAPELWERAEQTDRLIARVVVDRPLDRVFEYVVPEALRDAVGAGQRVRVPFGRGNQTVRAFCVGTSDRAESKRKLKDVASVIDASPIVSETMLGLTRWIADRYLCSWGQVLETVVPAGVKKNAGTREVLFFDLAEGVAERVETERWPAKQLAVLRALIAAGRPMASDELATAAGCKGGPIATLRKKVVLQTLRRRVLSDGQLPAATAVAAEEDLTLAKQQQDALDGVLTAVRSGEHSTLLLHGVTGSGKTEVYMQAIREVVSYGRQAIVLVPEISLTPQTIRRFRSRFDGVAVLHSHLTDSERHRQWLDIAEGRVQVVVGARSAVFAPVPALGLIVIDEEHETTFKQQTTPRYHAREVARERARRESVPLLLGTATPTLESIRRVKAEGDVYLGMPERVSGRPMPPVSLVDVRNDPFVGKGHSIGRALGQAITQAVRDGGQVILFLNLRGYSPVLWCVKCAAGLECPNCSVTLTWHRDREMALCHSCDYETAPPPLCPTCEESVLKFLGSGTQRLEKEVRHKFPELRLARMDSDSMRKAGAHDATLSAFAAGETDLLLGTQMIAKGLDFPNVTLVGVVDADTMLHQPDFRAAERTFHLVSQVAGRTGRGDKGGRVIVQTMAPGEPVLQQAAAHDFRTFVKSELGQRREMSAPPFAALARVILRGPDETAVTEQIAAVAGLFRDEAKRQDAGVMVLGPAPAPMLRLRGMYRHHLRLTAPTAEDLRALWRAVEGKIELPKDYELTIDVDPLDMR